MAVFDGDALRQDCQILGADGLTHHTAAHGLHGAQVIADEAWRHIRLGGNLIAGDVAIALALTQREAGFEDIGAGCLFHDVGSIDELVKVYTL